MRSRPRSWLFGIVLAVAVLTPAAAFAAPKVSLKYTNPVAYDLKSLKTTRFYASVDTAHVWADLRIRTPEGDKVIYKGPIETANKNFYFPLWNGKDADGDRMPTGSYTYLLTVSKAGQTTTVTGTILVSKVYINRKEHFVPDPDDIRSPERLWDIYLVPGNLNFYVSAESTAGTPLSIGLFFGDRPFPPKFGWNLEVEPSVPFRLTKYLRPPNVLSYSWSGQIQFSFLQELEYEFTFVQ